VKQKRHCTCTWVCMFVHICWYIN